MAKNSQEYWAKRRRQDKVKVINTGEKGIDNLKRLLLLNLKDVERQIKEFYDKYGDNPAEEMSYKDFEKYKAKLSRMAKANPQDKILQKLAKQDIPKYRIDRLRALQGELQMQLTEATNGQEKGIYNTLDDVSKVSQSVLAKTMQASIGLKFNTIASKKMKQILMSDWSGANWSERLWKDREKVGKKLTDILEKGVVQGTSLQKMSRELRDVTGQSFNNAFRLIRTETSHIDGQVTLEGYKQAGKELGLEYYEYDAFLDSRTSELCRNLDKKRFKVSEAEVGVNYPPMHPNCRSTTQLVLDEDFEREREAAKSVYSEDNKKFKEIEKQSKEELKDLKEVREISKKIKEVGAFKNNVDLDGISLEVAQNLYITSNKIFSRYPQLKGLDELIVSSEVAKGNFADNLSQIGSIRLNKKYFTDDKLLIKEYLNSVEFNIHPQKTTYEALLAHEIGHSLGEYLEKEKGLSRNQVKKDVLKVANYTAKDVPEKLSESADYNASEFIAEAFAEYVNSPNPRKLAKKFGEYINKKLN
jgi:SPP1 gp7 family putative phage head morphogenesis protein